MDFKRQSQHVINQWKEEIAAELGLFSSSFHYGSFDTEMSDELGAVSSSSSYAKTWRDVTSREAGSVGGEITRRLIAHAQQFVK